MIILGCIISILFFKKIIKILFKKYDYHTLFRSFFCLFISSCSMGISLLEWDSLISDPLGTSILTKWINIMMLSYMLIDTGYFLYKQNYRTELMIHHFACIGIYGLYLNFRILSFCAGCEILSAFNWVGIIFPGFEWASKLFRLYSILFIRLFIWIYTLIFLYNLQIGFKFIFILLILLIFISLDIYWTYIIILNYTKYKNFISNTIIAKKNKIIKKIKKSHKN